MSKIIIYGSCYGTTQKYAEELSARSGIDVKSYKEFKNINDYQMIIYLGGLYAGGVEGMKRTLKPLTDVAGRNIIIATVGLADPNDQKNVETIRNKMKSQISPEIYAKAHIFHLRGGIDYSALSLVHKTMMKMVYNKAVRIPEEEKTAEIRAMIETYNTCVDFVDLKSLEPIVECLRSASNAH